MNIRDNSRRSGLLFAIGLVAAILLVVLAVRQIQRLSADGKIWVASAGLGSGSLIEETDLRLAAARGGLPQDVLRERGQIQGRQLTRRKQEGAPFTDADFAETAEQTAEQGPSPGIAADIPEGRVLMPLSISPSLFPSSLLRRGDRIDIIATDRQGDTELVVRDGFLMGQNRHERTRPAQQQARRGPFGIDMTSSAERTKPPPLYLYLGVHPEDAVSLSRAQGASATLKIVMHSRDDVQAGRVSDLGADKQQTVELIRGSDREIVPVAY